MRYAAKVFGPLFAVGQRVKFESWNPVRGRLICGIVWKYEPKK
jgi:hypothetical protein